MPQGMGVAALCRKIREVDRWVPIIIYSDATIESYRQAALVGEASALVTKPYFSDLLEAVNAELDL